MEVNFGIFIYFFITIFIFERNSLAYGEPNYGMGGELHSHCSSTKDCRYFGYVCRENSCQCEQWYIPDRDRRTCVGGVDQKCLYDEHCIDGAYCMNQSICKCKYSSSLALDHGLICAGAMGLKHQLLGLSFLVISSTVATLVLLYT